jgi:hypothetical protein
MRKAAAALLLLAAVPLFAADPAPRKKIIQAVVAMTRVEQIEQAAISAAIDVLLAQASTTEQKEPLEQLRHRALAQSTRDTWMAAFDHAFDDKALAGLADCYKNEPVQRALELTAFTLRDTIQERMKPVEVTAAERDLRAAKKTMADLRTIATALEARATDTNEYPESCDMETLRKLLEPAYVSRMPSRDAWGHELVYVGSPSHQTYRFVSAGADGVFDARSKQIDDVPPRETDSFDEDIVFQNGQFLQYPRGIVKKEDQP